MPTGTTYIKYAGLRYTSSVSVSDTTVAGHNAMLSYNIDTAGSTTWNFSQCDPFNIETVQFSQEPLDARMAIPRSLSQQQRPANPAAGHGPYPISAGDMLRQNGHNNNAPDFELSKFRKGIKNNE